MQFVTQAGVTPEKVSQIACYASEVVIPVVPKSVAYLNNLPSTQRRNIFGSIDTLTQIQSSRFNVDPFSTILSAAQQGKVVSAIVPSSLLIQSLPYIKKLGNFPVTIHVVVGDDFGDISAVRDCGLAIIQSFDEDDGADMAVAAHATSLSTKKAVLHFFESGLCKSNDYSRILEEVNPTLNSPVVYSPLETNTVSNTTIEGQIHTSSKPVDVLQSLLSTFQKISTLTGRRYSPFIYDGPESPSRVFVMFSSTLLFRLHLPNYIGILRIRIYRPFSDLSAFIPKSVASIAVIEQSTQTTKWMPVYLDILLNINPSIKVVSTILGRISQDTIDQAIRGIIQNLERPSPVQDLLVGHPIASVIEKLSQPRLESTYMKILEKIFGDRLVIGNYGMYSSDPEAALGRFLADEREKEEFRQTVSLNFEHSDLSSTSKSVIGKWLLDKKTPNVLTTLEGDSSSFAKFLLENKQFLINLSRWIISSDAWAYDLGSSGVHHLLSLNFPANMLIIDSEPYANRSRKKDIGLYAMNFGNAYVASVAVYGNYSLVLQALVEADEYPGPSVVLAYLPYFEENDSPITVLQETKRAIEEGYWPLYTWKNGDFELYSERIKRELGEFLDRENLLTGLANRNPIYEPLLVSSLEYERQELQKQKANAAYNSLIEGLSGPKLTILYGSDGGNAEALSKRLSQRAKARGLKPIVMAMDAFPIDELSTSGIVVFISAVAGQGEFPQNARGFWSILKNTVVDVVNVSFAVFGLGDSHYWPRKEDKMYFNKPAVDLDSRLEKLGAKRLIPVGLGDDQDPDGYETRYQTWELDLWKALDVANVAVIEMEEPSITNEDIKLGSNFLRGTIAQGLEDNSTGAIAETDTQLTKFHGIYQQDDRDLRDERRANGLEPAYIFMIRVRMPAGVCRASQWLAMDDIADRFGNHTFKLTTRQTFQFHGVLKRNGKLKGAIQAINRALLTTIGACGDVARNVCLTSTPHPLHTQLLHFATRLSKHLEPSTSAYHEIWLTDESGKKQQVAGNAVVDMEPLYGPSYLPRKFKLGIAVPPSNDVDIYTNDVGFIAIIRDGKLYGFNVTIGGGMGTTHNNKKTYPRLGDLIGFVSPDQAIEVSEKIMLVQRDYGDRTNRKHARLKYTIDDHGIEWFVKEVEKRLGFTFQPAQPFSFDSNVDKFGWSETEDGKHHFCMFIENGRVFDEAKLNMKAGLREIASYFQSDEDFCFRLTANQHLYLSNISKDRLADVKNMLMKWELDNLSFSVTTEMIVALPTCGLAMAESERYLPLLISKVEEILEEEGLRHDSIVMRMTGCPNGCARPFVAEIAFVGKAPGTYNMYLGGGYYGQRLNKLYKASLDEEQILELLRPLIKRYSLERKDGERFGDWTIRAGVIKATLNGLDFHNGTEDSVE